MSTPPAIVLDASALLVYLQGETGHERVAEAIATGAAMSAVNWAETLSKLAEAGQDPDEAASRLAERGVLHAGLVILPLDESGARDIARLRPLTRTAGLSTGDRACLALGRTLRLPVLTANRAWKNVRAGVKVEAVR